MKLFFLISLSRKRERVPSAATGGEGVPHNSRLLEVGATCYMNLDIPLTHIPLTHIPLTQALSPGGGEGGLGRRASRVEH